MSFQNFNRRTFLRTFAVAPFAAALGLGRIAFAAVDAAKQMVAPTDSMASTLKYAPDAKTVPVAVRPDVKAVCTTCVQYQDKQAQTVNGESVAPCIIFGGKFVHGKGWCSVWAGPKKA